MVSHMSYQQAPCNNSDDNAATDMVLEACIQQQWLGHGLGSIQLCIDYCSGEVLLLRCQYDIGSHMPAGVHSASAAP